MSASAREKRERGAEAAPQQEKTHATKAKRRRRGWDRNQQLLRFHSRLGLDSHPSKRHAAVGHLVLLAVLLHQHAKAGIADGDVVLAAPGLLEGVEELVLAGKRHVWWGCQEKSDKEGGIMVQGSNQDWSREEKRTGRGRPLPGPHTQGKKAEKRRKKAHP